MCVYEKRYFRAFTILELMIVITIILLLVALLLPSLFRTKERTRRVVCNNSQRQFIMTMNLIAKDNNGMYPDFNDAGSWRHIHWLKNDMYDMLKEDYKIDMHVDIDCPSRPNTWNAHNIRGRQRFGYFLQVGRSYVTTFNKKGIAQNKTKGFDGQLGYEWVEWESPIKVEGSNDLVMISDADEYMLNIGFEKTIMKGGRETSQTPIGKGTMISHGPSGYLQKIGAAVEPEILASEGVMVGYSDGSVQWVDIEDVKPRRSNIGENRKTGWW